MQSVIEKAKAIKLLVLDVDGVLTDGRLFFDFFGNEYKSFHVRDGHGIKLLQRTGIKIAIITGRKSRSVALRMKMLDIRYVHQGQENKGDALDKLLIETGYSFQQTAFVGDDWLDLPIMSRVGLAVAVADAHPEVRERAHWRTSLCGGHGAVREVCDLVMRAQGTYSAILESYLQ